MNYEEALEYIHQLNEKGVSLGLERIWQLLELLGHPEQSLRCIHVAGTNGKGSVCAFLDSALQQAGLRVGRYISPTLYDYRERIQVNGVYIAPDALAQLLTAIKQACQQLEQQGQECPTVFEVETALAFLYFRGHGRQTGFYQRNCETGIVGDYQHQSGSYPHAGYNSGRHCGRKRRHYQSGVSCGVGCAAGGSAVGFAGAMRTLSGNACAGGSG